MENIRSLYNVGAILRTCSFFGVKNVVLVGYSGKRTLPNGRKVLHEKLTKTALSSQDDLKIEFVDTSKELIEYARDHKLKIVVFEQNKSSVRLSKWKPENNCILIFGNEVDGVGEELIKAADKTIEIERRGNHNSLNVEVAAGIAIQKAMSVIPS